MSSWATSAMRRSRSVFEARSTAALAAFSQESVLVPTSSMILYTLSAMAGSFLALLEGAFLKAAFIALARRLEQPGRAHAAADAHGDDAPALLPPAQLVEQRPGHARAGHAVGVADRDRAAVRVELLGVDAEAVAAVDDLRGEGLVQLDDVDVLELEPRMLEQLRHREDRPDPHLVGLAGREHAAAEEAERPHAERLRTLGRHDERRRGAVRELGGVAGRHRTALLEGGGQLGEALERGVGAVALVTVDDDLLARLLARRLVGHLHGGLHGRDLVLELALPLRGGGALLGEERVAVLRLAAHLVALGHDLGGLAHGHVDGAVVVLEVGVEEVRLVEVVLQHGDRLEAAADDDVVALDLHHVRGDHDGVEPRGAEAAHGAARDRDRQPGQQRHVAPGVEALWALGEAGPHDHVLDLGRVELGDLLEQVLDAVGGHVIGPRQVERATEGLGEPGPRARYDHCITHDGLLRLVGYVSRISRRIGPPDASPGWGGRRLRVDGPGRGGRGARASVPATPLTPRGAPPRRSPTCFARRLAAP